MRMTAHIAACSSTGAASATWQSWAKYVSRYGDPATTFATYSEHGLSAVLDYHTPDAPGRGEWVVVL